MSRSWRQLRVLHREFLFRIVDRELLSTHAQGDMSKLLIQFAALLIFVSLVFVVHDAAARERAGATVAHPARLGATCTA